MKALTYVLRLCEPLLVTQPHSGEANSGTSSAYVPGSSIRGALIKAYRSHHQLPLENSLDTDDTARRLFFSSDTRFLHAYPWDAQRQARLLPTPRSWFTEKEDAADPTTPCYDLALPYPSGMEELKKPKAPAGEFCCLDGVAYHRDSKRQITLHNASSDRNEKKQGSSQVFRYEAIATGEQLAGVVLSDNQADLEMLQGWLQETVLVLGGSHTGGYGRVEVISTEITDDWQEYNPEEEFSDLLIITLLSDTILRHPVTGQITTSLTDIPGFKPQKSFQGVTLVGGFNRTWGLPLVQTWAIAAGSVFQFAADSLSPDQINDLVTNGLGERRQEGFGRVAVNWHKQSQRERCELEPPALTIATPLSSAHEEQLKTMADRLLRRQLEAGLVSALDANKGNFRALPSVAQLSQVRLAAQRVLLTGQKGGISQHLEGLKKAKEQWREARLGQKKLWEWLQTRETLDETDFKAQFGLTGELPRLGEVKSSLTPELRAEFTARLVDGVMKQAIEKKKAEVGRG
jgi:CRISPR-associated protein Csx10